MKVDKRPARRYPEGMRSRAYVVVEGLPGAGKTALATALAAQLGGRLVLDEAENNPFLGAFRAHPRDQALPTQLYFLMTRIQNQRLLAQEDLFSAWTFGDALLDRDALYAERCLSPEELRGYHKLAQAAAPHRRAPDLVVYLHSAGPAPETLPEPLIEPLTRGYVRLLSRYTPAPVLRVDTTAMDLSDPAAVRQLSEVLQQTRPPEGAIQAWGRRAEELKTTPTTGASRRPARAGTATGRGT